MQKKAQRERTRLHVFSNDSKTDSNFLISAGTDQNYWSFKILYLPSVKKTNMNQ